MGETQFEVDFWGRWNSLFRRLRPPQAKRLLAEWALFEAVAWGQVDLTWWSRCNWKQVPLAAASAQGSDQPVRELDRKVRALVGVLTRRHPQLLKHLPDLVWLLTLWADFTLEGRPLIVSSLARTFKVPGSSLGLYDLMVSCEFGGYGSGLSQLPWHQDNLRPSDHPFARARLIRPQYASGVQVVNQVRDMRCELAGLRSLLLFAREWRDFGDQDLVILALSEPGLKQVPAYSYAASGKTSLGLIQTSQIDWMLPEVRVLAVSPSESRD